jgi:tellurite resistance protein TehA-like permease
MQGPASTIAIAAVVALLIWRTYARVRRMVGRQRLSKVRPWITLTIFPLLIVLLASSAVAHPERLVLLAVALAAGGALAVFGLRRTVFEPTPQGLFYTPNAHIGIALSMLFVARIAYRFFELGTLDPAAFGGGNGHAPDFARSPLTLGVFGLLAGYYVGYAIGLLRWRAGVLRTKREREAAAAAASAGAPAAAPGGGSAPSSPPAAGTER